MMQVQYKYTKRSPNTIVHVHVDARLTAAADARKENWRKRRPWLHLLYQILYITTTVQGRNHKPAANDSPAWLSHICNFPPQVMYTYPIQCSTLQCCTSNTALFYASFSTASLTRYDRRLLQITKRAHVVSATV